MAVAGIEITDDGATIRIFDSVTLATIYASKDGFSISNNATHIFIQTADNKKYEYAYTQVTVPVSVNIADLVTQIQTMLDSADIATALADINTELDAQSVLMGLTNTKLDAANASLDSLEVKADTTNTKLDALNLQKQLFDGDSFRSIISRASLAAPENMVLFLNGATKNVRINLLDLFFDVATVTGWEIYLNPTVIANGVAAAGINNKTNSVTLPTAILYNAPTIGALGTLINAFTTLTEGRSYVRTPYLLLAPTHLLLIRRTSSGAGNTLRLNLNWSELVP